MIRKATTSLRSYLGLERNVLVMTMARNIWGFGAGLWTGYLPKVLETLGAGGPVIGAFGTISNGTGMIFSYLGGAISDRLGRGRVMILAAGISLIGYVIYLISPTWWPFIPGSVLLAASAFFSFMGSLALIGETVGTERRAVSMASQRIIGMPLALLAPPVGGFLILRLGILGGFRTSLAVTIALTLLAVWIQRRLYRLPPAAATRLSLNLKTAWRAMPKRLRYLLFANSVMSFGSHMFSLFIVLYVMNIVKASAVFYGVLQSIMIGASALFSIPAGKLSDRIGLASRKRYASLAFLLIAFFPFLLLAAPSPGWLIPVFVLRGVRESFETARKSMILDLAGKGEHGRVIGLYFLITGAAAFPASYIAGWLWRWRPASPFFIGGLVCAIGFLAYLWGMHRAGLSNSPLAGEENFEEVGK
jgi:MFS family permease